MEENVVCVPVHFFRCRSFSPVRASIFQFLTAAIKKNSFFSPNGIGLLFLTLALALSLLSTSIGFVVVVFLFLSLKVKAKVRARRKATKLQK